MTRTTDYDIEAADLVARTLRAVAGDTDVTEPPGDVLPVAGLPAPIPLGTHRLRHRHVRRTLAATAAAAAVLVASLVWAGRNPSDPSDPTTTGDLGPADQGVGELPAELVPDDTAGMATEPGAVYSDSTRYATRARIVQTATGGRILTAVVTWPEGQEADKDELSRVVQALAAVVGGDETRAQTTATVGGRDGYLTLPLDGDVDESVVAQVHGEVVPPGVGIDGLDTAGWATLPTDISWVPGITPTVVRHYSDGDVATVDLSSTAGDIGGAMTMVALLPEARPYPVGRAMGWTAPLAHGRSLFVWQAAPGTVGLIVASEAAEPGVGAMIGSIPAPAAVPGDHPDARLVGRSADGGDVPWVVEALDYLPTHGGPSGADNRDCIGLWVGGQAPLTSCGTEIPPELSYYRTFGAVTQVGDDTVVFAEVAPAVAAVVTDAPGAEHATVETQPIDPTRPDSLRYAVLIVHGDRDEPQTFRLLGAGGEELYTTEFDLNEVGG